MAFAALRSPRRTARLARALWIAWAVVAWNVVFDHVVVAAGRRYVAAAASAAALPQPRYENMDAWMQPAVTRGLWLASGAALVILGCGLPLVAAAARRQTAASDPPPLAEKTGELRRDLAEAPRAKAGQRPEAP